jgi:hypothetical protein
LFRVTKYAVPRATAITVAMISARTVIDAPARIAGVALLLPVAAASRSSCASRSTA